MHISNYRLIEFLLSYAFLIYHLLTASRKRLSYWITKYLSHPYLYLVFLFTKFNFRFNESMSDYVIRKLSFFTIFTNKVSSPNNTLNSLLQHNDINNKITIVHQAKDTLLLKRIGNFWGAYNTYVEAYPIVIEKQYNRFILQLLFPLK